MQAQIKQNRAKLKSQVFSNFPLDSRASSATLSFFLLCVTSMAFNIFYVEKNSLREKASFVAYVKVYFYD